MVLNCHWSYWVESSWNWRMWPTCFTRWRWEWIADMKMTVGGWGRKGMWKQRWQTCNHRGYMNFKDNKLLKNVKNQVSMPDKTGKRLYFKCCYLEASAFGDTTPILKEICTQERTTLWQNKYCIRWLASPVHINRINSNGCRRHCIEKTNTNTITSGEINQESMG